MYNYVIYTALLFVTTTNLISSANANFNTSIAENDKVLIRNKRGFGGTKVIYNFHYLSSVKSSLAAALYLLMCAENFLERQVIEDKFCRINVKNLKLEHSLIINPKDRYEFLYPDDKGNIYFKEGDSVFLSCAMEGDNYFELLPEKKADNFFCVCGSIFTDYSQLFDFYELTCIDPPKHSIKVVKDDTYEKTLWIGFKVSSWALDFVMVYEVNYAMDTKLPMRTMHVVSKSLLGGQKTNVKVALPSSACCMFRPGIIRAFNEDSQLRSLSEQIPSESFTYYGQKLFKNNDCNIFGREYLSPRKAFVYSAAALATYHFTNIVPMFRCISKGNWPKIIKHINEIAVMWKHDLTVYTGVYKTLSLLNNLSKTNEDLYLSLTRKSTTDHWKKDYPIPLYFYAVVLDYQQNIGVVYVTVNNIFITDKTVKSFHLCENPIFEMTGVKMPQGWQPKNYSQGYSYMCDIDDFQTTSKIVIDSMVGSKMLSISSYPVAYGRSSNYDRTEFK